MAAALPPSLIDPNDTRPPRERTWGTADFGMIVFDEGHSPVVDIIAVHGLGGHRERSWMAKNGKIWLRDFLPQNIPNARILSFGYDSTSSKNPEKNYTALHDHGSSLIKAIIELQKQVIRPIILIGHSLGGLVIRTALLESSLSTCAEYKPVLRATYSVLFLGTPQQGVEHDIALWSGMVVGIMALVKNTDAIVYRTLEKGSVYLLTQDDHWVNMVSKLETVCFYETIKTCISKPLRISKIIVTRESAAPQGQPNVRVIPMSADHKQMSKYAILTEQNYVVMAENLASVVEKRPTVIGSNWTKKI